MYISSAVIGGNPAVQQQVLIIVKQKLLLVTNLNASDPNDLCLCALVKKP